MFLIPWAIALLFLLNVVVTVVLWILGDTERLRQEVHRAYCVVDRATEISDLIRSES